MKVRKTIKKIAALGIGISMLGTTVLGAMAADLANYPNPLFIEDGEFQGAIILGDNAIAADTLGAIDIATGLQFSGTSTGVGISDGVLVEASGDKLSIDEDLYDVDSTGLDSEDLPEILADGVVDESEGEYDNKEEYTQEIDFIDATGTLELVRDDDEAPEGGLYVVFDRSTKMYNYTLEFDNYLEYDDTSVSTASADLETVKVEIQGNLYTITDVKMSGGKLSQLTLQVGDTTVWLEQGRPITKMVEGEEHEVELVNVNEDGDKCGITVDGTLEWIDTGSSQTINGVEVGATEAVVIHSEAKDTDVCEVNLGASEIILKDGDEVEINSVDIGGSNVEFDETTAGQLESISITHEPEDTIYLSDGDSVTDPVLGNFEFTFAGVTAKTTLVDLDVSGDDFTLTFNNIDGKEIKLPIYCGEGCDADGDQMFLGDSADIDDRYYFKDGICNATSVVDCEGARFLLEQGKELHVMEIADVDISDNETTIKDITYGGTKVTKDAITGANATFDVPGGSVTLAIDATSVTFSDDDLIAVDEKFYGEYEVELNISGVLANGTTNYSNGTTTGTYPTITVDEAQGENEDATLGTVAFTLAYDDTDEEIEIGAPTVSQAAAGNTVDVSDTNSDDKIYYSKYGTKVVFDNEEKRSAKVTFPEEELYGNVFVSPVGANIISGGTGGATKKIEVGTAKLASEVADLEAQNSIIVGGPCANEKAAEFLGVTMATCSEGAPEENTAVIKLQEYGDNVAMLVNGYDAIDTRRASRVLANYDDYDLSGDEVVVSGTDFSNIVVSTVE